MRWLIVLIIGIFVTMYLVSQRTSFFGKASVGETPREVRISNLSDNSFTISWLTDKATPGFISFGPNEKLGSIVEDDRDSSVPGNRLTHYVTVKNLAAEIDYFYKINNQGKLFKQKTAPVSKETPPLGEPLFGTVLKTDGKAAKEAIVYLKTGDSSLLSTFTRDGGIFLITLNNARKKDLTDFITISESDLIDLSIATGDEGVLQKTIQAKMRFSPLNLTLAEEEKPKIVGDLNGDGVVNALDFAVLVKRQLGL